MGGQATWGLALRYGSLLASVALVFQRGLWEFPKIRGTFKGILKGIYKSSIKGLGFRVSEGTLLWGPYSKAPTI